MDEDAFGAGSSTWFRKCICKKEFHQLNSYTNHIRSCLTYKTNAGATLQEAQVRYRARKSKIAKHKEASTSRYDDDDLDVDHPPLRSAGYSTTSGTEILPTFTELSAETTTARSGPQSVQPSSRPESPQAMEVDVEAPQAEYGRGHRVRQAIERFKDFAPTSTIPFDIPSLTIDLEAEINPLEPTPHTTPPPNPEPADIQPPPSEVLRRTIFDEQSWKSTPSNRFGLYKKFWTTESRPHDPDRYITSKDLREEAEDLTPATITHDKHSPSEDLDELAPAATDSPPTRPGIDKKVPKNPYFPFPNWSSFRLGEWYWDDRREKGQQSFQQLIEILTSDDFSMADIRAAKWDRINGSLAASEYHDGDGVQVGHELDPDWFGDGLSWRSTPILLKVPFNRTSAAAGVHNYEVPNFRYRPLVPIITEHLKDAARGEYFHVVPSDLRWQPRGPGGPDMRIYGELYNSPAFLEAYKEIQALPPERTESSLPRYVVALMFASDETMLASFGGKKLWPLYMMFGNESKDRRNKSSLKLFEEVAYFESVPDGFGDWYLSCSGKKNVSVPLSTHLNRELFQEQWRMLLDDDFVEAYDQGIVVDCFDTVRRRFYPRIMTYAADYPERAKIVGIRNMGDCPCPRCLVPLTGAHKLGTPENSAMRRDNQRKDDQERKDKIEKARRMIYRQNYSVNTAEVEKLLKPTSLVPAQNAISDRLSRFGLDVYRLVAVDILHEFEIGVWMSLFIQLLRLLEAVDKSLLNILNTRFRQMPTFGTDTIRRFGTNVSEMKQLAARDYEDILQCAIAAFEGMIPGEHGQHVQTLLFIFAHWHSLAKLRLHTDDTLALLDEWTVTLGAESRQFVDETCGAFETRELKREYEARKRGEARRKAKQNVAASTPPISEPPLGEGDDPSPGAAASSSKSKTRGGAKSKSKSTARGRQPKKVAPNARPTQAGAPSTRAHCDDPLTPHLHNTTQAQTDNLPSAPTVTPSDEPPAARVTDSRQVKVWSLNTSKFHAMGDVADYIRAFGTTDSYSTQLSEHFHRFPKARFRRTNKKQTPYQLSRIQTRQTRLKKLRNQLIPASDEGPADTGGDPSYFIGKSQNKPVSLPRFLSANSGDPAVKSFVLKLRQHLILRIIESLLQEARQSPEDHPVSLPVLEQLHKAGVFSDAHLNGIYIHSDRVYRHSILQVHYTTYDCRRAVDTINPSTSRHHIMCLRPQPPRPSNPGQPGESNLGQKPPKAPQRFIYGRILGVFHVNIIYGGPGMIDHRPRRFNFLWVRWFDPVDPEFSEARLWSSKRMDRAKPRPISDPEACDFIDPSDVIRAAHIIPRFAEGKQYEPEELYSDRIASKCARDADDWKEYYINPFVDRDMMMRFHWGMAVGHIYTRGRESQSDVSTIPQGFPATTAGQGERRHREGGVGTSAEQPIDVDFDDSGGQLNPPDSDDSDNSAYDKPQGSEIDFNPNDQDFLTGVEGEIPDIQEPEESDKGDDIYV